MRGVVLSRGAEVAITEVFKRNLRVCLRAARGCREFLKPVASGAQAYGAEEGGGGELACVGGWANKMRADKGLEICRKWF